jgi:hypothetical protein
MPQATTNTNSYIFSDCKYLYVFNQYCTPSSSALYLIAIHLRLSQIKRHLQLLIHLVPKRLILTVLIPSASLRACVCLSVYLCVCVSGTSSLCYAVLVYIEYHCCLKPNVITVYVAHLHVQPSYIHYIIIVI